MTKKDCVVLNHGTNFLKWVLAERVLEVIKRESDAFKGVSVEVAAVEDSTITFLGRKV
jgi:hypothetical protein